MMYYCSMVLCIFFKTKTWSRGAAELHATAGMSMVPMLRTLSVTTRKGDIVSMKDALSSQTEVVVVHLLRRYG